MATVIIEVLSPNTEAFDRGEKFRRYRLFNPSLSDYVLVAQDQPLIEHFVRQEHGQWFLTASVSNLSGSVFLASIQLTDVTSAGATPAAYWRDTGALLA